MEEHQPHQKRLKKSLKSNLTIIIDEKLIQIDKKLKEISTLAVKLFGDADYDISQVKTLLELEGVEVIMRGLFWAARRELRLGDAKYLRFTPMAIEVINKIPLLKKEYEEFFTFEKKFLKWFREKNDSELIAIDTRQLSKEFNERIKSRIGKIEEMSNSLFFESQEVPGLIMQIKGIVEDPNRQDLYEYLDIVDYVRQIVEVSIEMSRKYEEIMTLILGEEKETEEGIERENSLLDILSAEINRFKDEIEELSEDKENIIERIAKEILLMDNRMAKRLCVICKKDISSKRLDAKGCSPECYDRYKYLLKRYKEELKQNNIPWNKVQNKILEIVGDIKEIKRKKELDIE